VDAADKVLPRDEAYLKHLFIGTLAADDACSSVDLTYDDAIETVEKIIEELCRKEQSKR